MPFRMSDEEFANFQKVSGLDDVTVAAMKKSSRKRNRTLENKFDTLWKHCGGADVEWVKDYQFDLPHSKMEMDRALPDLRIGIELQGGQNLGGKSGHANWYGLERDATKINRCVIIGWTLFQLTTSMVKPEHIDPIVEYINQKLQERG